MMPADRAEDLRTQRQVEIPLAERAGRVLAVCVADHQLPGATFVQAMSTSLKRAYSKRRHCVEFTYITVPRSQRRYPEPSPWTPGRYCTVSVREGEAGVEMAV